MKESCLLSPGGTSPSGGHDPRPAAQAALSAGLPARRHRLPGVRDGGGEPRQQLVGQRRQFRRRRAGHRRAADPEDEPHGGRREQWLRIQGRSLVIVLQGVLLRQWRRRRPGPSPAGDLPVPGRAAAAGQPRPLPVLELGGGRPVPPAGPPGAVAAGSAGRGRTQRVPDCVRAEPGHEEETAGDRRGDEQTHLPAGQLGLEPPKPSSPSQTNDSRLLFIYCRF